MSRIFYNCTDLVNLPNIHDWNMLHVTDISAMFCGCNALKSLPDISEWDTKNVTNMSYMFCGCISLKLLPDISKWVLNKKLKKECIFKGVNEKIIPKKFQCCIIY